MKNLVALSLLFCLVPASSAQQNDASPEAAQAAPAPAIKVEKLAVGSAVVKRELLGESAVFPKEAGSVYVWAKVTAEETPCALKFVYYLNGKKVRELAVDVKFSPYRTWTNKNVVPGDWKVELRDEAGNLLASAEFKVTDKTEPAAETEAKEKN